LKHTCSVNENHIPERKFQGELEYYQKMPEQRPERISHLSHISKEMAQTDFSFVFGNDAQVIKKGR
jgi:hypothetical protein